MSYVFKYNQFPSDKPSSTTCFESNKHYPSNVRNKSDNVHSFDFGSNDELTIVSTEDCDWFLYSKDWSSVYADLILNNSFMYLSGHSKGIVDIANSTLTSKLLDNSSMKYTIKNDSALISQIGDNATSEIYLDDSLLTLTAKGNSVTDIHSYDSYLEIDAEKNAVVNVYARGRTNIDFICAPGATIMIEQYGLNCKVQDITPEPDNVFGNYSGPISIDAGISCVGSIGESAQNPTKVNALITS